MGSAIPCRDNRDEVDWFQWSRRSRPHTGQACQYPFSPCGSRYRKMTLGSSCSRSVIIVRAGSGKPRGRGRADPVRATSPASAPKGSRRHVEPGLLRLRWLDSGRRSTQDAHARGQVLGYARNGLAFARQQAMANLRGGARRCTPIGGSTSKPMVPFRSISPSSATIVITRLAFGLVTFTLGPLRTTHAIVSSEGVVAAVHARKHAVEVIC